jgi:hypothetical protein
VCCCCSCDGVVVVVGSLVRLDVAFASSSAYFGKVVEEEPAGGSTDR